VPPIFIATGRPQPLCPAGLPANGGRRRRLAIACFAGSSRVDFAPGPGRLAPPPALWSGHGGYSSPSSPVTCAS